MNHGRGYRRYVLGVLAVAGILALALAYGPGLGDFLGGPAQAKITPEVAASPAEGPVLDHRDPQIRAVMEVQQRHTPELLELPEVVGTATGLTEADLPAVLVFTAREVPPGLIPRQLEGAPVVVQVTGKFLAMPKPDKPPKPPRGNKIDPTSRFERAVPIGVSTGNAGECSGGTIGARVTDGTKVYALSNNHVYALENYAPIGSEILQPGLYDTGCGYDAGNVIGTLDDFEPLVFFTTANNTIDAALALSNIKQLGNSTPKNGYGMPQSALVEAELYQSVQKYGRTSSLTKGTVTGLNATVNVGYSSGTARFDDQIVVTAVKPFIKAGDSGSLLVTDPGKNPVGLLFAGTSSGKYAVANRIDLVLDRFHVSIDGDEKP